MFTRKKITVPSAGENLIFSLSGVSIIVENMPSYSSPRQVPTLSFGDSSNNPQPLYNQSTYFYGDGFNRLVISGTSESAGDEIYILASDQCLQEEINSDATQTARATLKATFSIACDDTVKTLSSLQILKDGQNPSAMYISATGGAVNYAFDADPEQDTSGGELAHVLTENETQKIIGINFIEAFNFIAGATGTGSSISITLEY